MHVVLILYLFFFFNDTAPTEIYTLSLHDALPICLWRPWLGLRQVVDPFLGHAEFIWAVVYRWDLLEVVERRRDRKSTRLNSSHQIISYAVFCLKKKKKQKKDKKIQYNEQYSHDES